MKATELVFILDKSGSMAGLESDSIGGFNAMLQKQKALPGECRTPRYCSTTVTSYSTTASISVQSAP